MPLSIITLCGEIHVLARIPNPTLLLADFLDAAQPFDAIRIATFNLTINMLTTVWAHRIPLDNDCAQRHLPFRRYFLPTKPAILG
jgi:hypothetical protein